MSDQLVEQIHRSTKSFPTEERFGLRSQIRSASLSVASNIVEGSARRSTHEYLNFLNIAAASAAETRYLVDISRRLGFLREGDAEQLIAGYTELAAGLGALLRALKPTPRLSPKP